MSPENWLVISVPAGDEDVSAMVAELLVELGGQAVQETAGRLETYVPPPADVDGWLATARASIASVAAELASDIAWRWEPNRDWSHEWRAGLGARRVGRHFVVTPSWVAPATSPGEHVLVIDPEMAFGTGEHATTRGALRLLERVVRPGHRVLDVGAGSAILAIGAAMMGAEHVLAVECDPDAIGNARDNVVRNGVAERVEIVQALVDDAFLTRHGAEFDVILANVLSGVLKPLLSGFRGALRPGGHLVLGGILTDEAGEMRAAIDRSGLRIVLEDVEDEWWSMLCG